MERHPSPGPIEVELGAAMQRSPKLPSRSTSVESSPQSVGNHTLLSQKLEEIVTRMTDKEGGVPIKTVKSLLSSVHSVITGAELVSWLAADLHLTDSNHALHLAHMIAIHGYVFPIGRFKRRSSIKAHLNRVRSVNAKNDDHAVTVRNDSSFYRFQTPCLWLSQAPEPNNIDYAIYLCKRTMCTKSRHQLAGYEAENFSQLQRRYAKQWDTIVISAEAQYRVDHARPKTEQKVLDSQERAFWDVHRPPTSAVNPMEMDYKKSWRLTSNRSNRLKPPGFDTLAEAVDPSPTSSSDSEERERSRLLSEIAKVTAQIEPYNQTKSAKSAQALVSHVQSYTNYDPFLIMPDPPNPWLAESTEFWSDDEAGPWRVRRWGLSVDEVLTDPLGVDKLTKFLESEYSVENIKFWQEAKSLRFLPASRIQKQAVDIYNTYLEANAPTPVNVDSVVSELVESRIWESPSRYCYVEAEEHIYKLMKNDSYQRFLRSNIYKEMLAAKKKTLFERHIGSRQLNIPRRLR